MGNNEAVEFVLADFLENQILHGKTVGVVIKPMTQEQARQMFPYRPASKYSESVFGGNNLVDDVALLLNELAKRCEMCATTTKNRYLRNKICPDCDGRTEYNGANPRLPGQDFYNKL